MACFVVPLGEAVVTSLLNQRFKRKKEEGKKDENNESNEVDFSWDQKLGLLTKMLWGGSGLLAFEHLWHGEIVPWPPFLTAMNNPADIAPMLHEIATVGTAMALAVTAVWGVMVVIISQKIKDEKNKSKAVIKGVK